MKMCCPLTEDKKNVNFGSFNRIMIKNKKKAKYTQKWFKTFNINHCSGAIENMCAKWNSRLQKNASVRQSEYIWHSGKIKDLFHCNVHPSKML